MAKKRFIVAFSPDASEVAAKKSPSSSVGPIYRRRSPNPPADCPNRRPPEQGPPSTQCSPATTTTTHRRGRTC